jgi:hypothetical protein
MEDSMLLAFYASGALALLVLVLGSTLAKTEGALLAWGAIASVLVLAQFLCLRQAIAPHSHSPDAKFVRADGIVSILAIAAYFILAIVKIARAHKRGSRETISVRNTGDRTAKQSSGRCLSSFLRYFSRRFAFSL